jgi:hypothetical protein
MEQVKNAEKEKASKPRKKRMDRLVADARMDAQQLCFWNNALQDRNYISVLSSLPISSRNQPSLPVQCLQITYFPNMCM